MKYKRLIAVISLTLLTLLITSCQSNKQEKTKVVVSYPQLMFPKYPAPNNNVLPLGYDGKVVRDEETEIANVIMPFWYYQLIMDYKVRVDKASAEYAAFIQSVPKSQ